MEDTTAQKLLDHWQRGNVLAADCPSRPVIQHLTSRWGTLVMVALATGPHRFAGLRRAVGGVSERMLSQTLKDLEACGFVLRTAHPVVPPHVDYELTPLGRAAAAHVVALAAWVETTLPQILAAQSSRLDQNCSTFSLSAASPTSFHENRASTPGRGA